VLYQLSYLGASLMPGLDLGATSGIEPQPTVERQRQAGQGSGIGVIVGLGVGIGDGVGEGLDVGVGEGVGLGLGAAVGDGETVGMGVGVGVGLGLGLNVGWGVGLGLGVRAGVAWLGVALGTSEGLGPFGPVPARTRPIISSTNTSSPRNIVAGVTRGDSLPFSGSIDTSLVQPGQRAHGTSVERPLAGQRTQAVDAVDDRRVGREEP
jgi:hypothetical protein